MNHHLLNPQKSPWSAASQNMTEVQARHGPLGPILMPSSSHEEWAQQMLIPSPAAVRNLLLPQSLSRSVSPILMQLPTSVKETSAMELKSSKKPNKTMPDSKVKKSGKPRTLLEVNRYIALIAHNGMRILHHILLFGFKLTDDFRTVPTGLLREQDGTLVHKSTCLNISTRR